LQSHFFGGALLTVLEAAYLFCYPTLPLGLVALYLLHRGREADHYWSVVTVAAYACYGVLPFFQTRPPRSIEKPGGVTRPPPAVRRFNVWVLRRASIHANTFPSAHVAASTACGLVLLPVAPAVAAVFLALACCVASGAVLGRYHYLADVILGALVGSAAFLIERCL